MDLPVMPPVAPMLAKLQAEIPAGRGWLYEPKWDGFRALVFRDGDEIYIGSRDKRPFLRYFPELEEPLRAALPDRCVVDGEIVIATPEGLDFDALLLRIHPAQSRVRLLASETPATYVAFDLLAEDDEDLSGAPTAERRARLERMLPKAATDEPPRGLQVVLTPQTDNLEVGRDWFEGLEALGLDGLIARRAESPYSPGKRTMVKLKHKRTADCVVGGYRLGKDGTGIGSLLLGVFDDNGNLHYIGHTSSFKAAERRELLERLRAFEDAAGGFGPGRMPGGPSRWTGGKDTSWVSLRPELVCEVAYDHLQGYRFRHAATFLRWRDDKRPEECTFDQVT
jgi:ATP-dependent DNA ligase